MKSADPHRIKLRHALLDHGLTETALAEKMHLSASILWRAVASDNSTFLAFRIRLRIQTLLGAFIWIPAEEYEELTALSSLLGVDLAKASMHEIVQAARAAGLAPKKAGKSFRGYELFAAIIHARFPNSATLNRPYYANLA